MPWKLILFLILLGIILAFVGFNAANTSDVSFGFYTFEEVPIFISLFVAFFLGALVSLPFAVRRRSTAPSKRPKSKERGAGGDNEEPAVSRNDNG